jgi:glycosyltransferase involved in cell wall biosynthesis
MPTIHLLTKNNEKTIEKTLQSIQGCNSRVIVGDMGSTDSTVRICEEYNAEVYRTHTLSRCEARNHLSKLSDKGWKMYIEPWEIMTQGHTSIDGINGKCCYGKVLQNGILTKEIRFWKIGEFVNPVYEKLNISGESEVDAMFYSVGGPDFTETFQLLDKWKSDHPTAPQPYYYHACLVLSAGRYNDFLNLSDHYMAMETNKLCLSAIMNRYYYALIHVIHKKDHKTALQNLNLCLCANPLMAEFWCLTGDVFYHLLNKFEDARQFYRNAMFLGSRRSSKDKWPMDIAKYRKYPEKMIKSCESIMDHKSIWGR